MEKLKYYLQSKIILYFIIAILCLLCTFLLIYFHNKENIYECPKCPENIAKTNEVEQTNTITVDIKGKVNNPGVYTISNNSLINDLIKLAGGVKSDGTTETLNLSKKLNDEDVIVVPSKTEVKKNKTSLTSSAGTISINKKNSVSVNSTTKEEDASSKEETIKFPISLNNATKEELMALDGIGDTKAQNIIAYRTKTPFKTIEDILNVSGIGETIFAKIKDNITI